MLKTEGDMQTDSLAQREPLMRRAESADLTQVAGIEAASYPTPWPEHFFARCLEIGYEFWVVSERDRVLAYAVMSFQGGVAHLMNLCVDSRQRRKGLGRKLLAHLIELAQKRQSGLFLEVRASNFPARELYRRAGLQVLGLRRNYYDSDNASEDAVVMALPWG